MLPEKTTDKTAAREVALKLLERAKAMMQVSLSGLERDQLSIANHWARSGIFPEEMESKLAYSMEVHMGLNEEDYYLYTIEQMHTAMDLIRTAQDYLS